MSIFNHFNHLNLSPGQETALTKLEAFLDSPVQVFMLKGYAGSGKTTILKGLVAYLDSLDKNSALMAPTGRAAKVIREKTGKEAQTIHKSIYSYDEMVEVEDGDSFVYSYKIRNSANILNKIFIIDEASMLSDKKSEGEFFRFGTGCLLTDLITYTRVSQESANTKIIFVGDPFQLPPVGDNSSKAFDKNYLFEKFQLCADEVEMKEVIRQGGESGILKTASKIRKSLSSGFFNDFSLKENNLDIFQPIVNLFLETWNKETNPKIIIASKNKTCHDLNQQIRALRFGKDNLPIQKADIVIMGGNNYRKGVFNGEFAVVNEISDTVNSSTIRFNKKSNSEASSVKPLVAEVTLNWRYIELIFPDADGESKIVKGQILENFLFGDNYLKPEEMQALYVDFKNRHSNLKPKTEEFKEAIIDDDYFNCLLIKYGYAVTCHKAQGGEWDSVFSIWDHDNRDHFNCLKDDQIRTGKANESFFRWAYTTITRASQKFYAINPPTFNSYSTITFVDFPVENAMNELLGTQKLTIDIIVDEKYKKALAYFGMIEEPIQLQDHFIAIDSTMKKNGIFVVEWERTGYEIRYKFQRDNSYVTGKTSVNGKYEFKNSILYIPATSNDEKLFKEIEALWNNLPIFSLNRETKEESFDRFQFETDIEEQQPFLKNLCDDIGFLLTKFGIVISEIKHLPYKERYTFKRNQQKVVIDFEFNKNGFFGRVLPLINQSNSNMLLIDIQKKLQRLNSK